MNLAQIGECESLKDGSKQDLNELERISVNTEEFNIKISSSRMQLFR